MTRREVPANSGSSRHGVRSDIPAEDAATPSGRVRLFDTLVCEWGGRSVELSHSLQRLVALLCVHPGPLTRQRAGQLLWPDQDARHASGSLRTAVWRLGHTCPGLVVGDDGRLALAPGCWVDYRERAAMAERLLRDPEAASLMSSVTMFVPGVTLLPGWYDDWVLLTRESIAGLRIQVLNRAADVFLERGEFARALDAALLALKAEPLNELIHMLVARVHLAQGNVSEALRQYDLCADLLGTELGIAPSDHFRALLPTRATGRPAREDATQRRVAAGSMTASMTPSV